MNVIIAGESPFVEEFAQLSVKVGFSTSIYLVEELIDLLHDKQIFEPVSNADVIVELHNQSVQAKKQLLIALSDMVSAESLVLTSALPISTTQAASWVDYSARMIGFSIIPPLEKNMIVELATAIQSSDLALNEATNFLTELGLKSIEVSDGPGLIRARIVCCLVNEAISALMDGIATAEDIDKAMKLGTNYPFGPLEWADYVGLDTVLGVMTGLFTEWGEERYRPSPYLKRLVMAGKLGVKSGEGFFEYSVQ